MKFTIPEACVPKGRPRTTFKDGRAITYTPPRSRIYAKEARTQALSEWNKQNVAPIPYPQPVKMEITFVLNRQATARPDIINLASQIADSLQGDKKNKPIAYDDDSQIVELHLYKVKGREPRTEVTVEALSDS